jgi:hypothetical protein
MDAFGTDTTVEGISSQSLIKSIGVQKSGGTFSGINA